MTRTVCLASYPKSGNTWLRMLIANLSAAGEPVDINDLPQRGGIASARESLDFVTLIDSGLLTHDECDSLRPRVCEAFARGAEDDAFEDTPPVRFVKVHNAYTFNVDDEPLLAGPRGADGAVVIVRDPRDVAPSFASHMGFDIDRAIDFMCDARAGFCLATNRQPNQLRQKLSGWSGHLASWLDQHDVPIQLVRYEDVHRDAAAVLRRVLGFVGLSVASDEIGRALEFAGFAELQRQERGKGFREAPRPWPHGNFFRRGEVGAWRDELTPDQVARIEADHGPMMARLGYAPSSSALSAAALVRAG